LLVGKRVDLRFLFSFADGNGGKAIKNESLSNWEEFAEILDKKLGNHFHQ
jgi:hypothetical protein